MNNFEIREPRLNEAGDILELNNKLDNETEFRAYEPGERKTSVEEYKSYLQNELLNTSVILVAYRNNTPVGMLEAIAGRFNRNRHLLHINIAVLKEYQGNGLGFTLFNELEKLARERNKLRLELTVFTYNEPAIKLYKKMGFHIEGTKQKSFMAKGRPVDEYIMAKILK